MSSSKRNGKYINILEWSDGSIHIEVLGTDRNIHLMSHEKDELEQYFQQKAME